jgi:hypothetical protein
MISALLSTAASLAAAATLVAPPASPEPLVAVRSCGQVVTTDAYLARNLLCPTGTAIELVGEGVDLDLRGHTLRGTRGSDGVLMDAWENHVVSHGTVQGFSTGVEYYQDQDDFPTGTGELTVDTVTFRDNGTGVSVVFQGIANVVGGRFLGNDVGVGTFFGSFQVSGGTAFRDNGVAVAQNARVTDATFTRNAVVAECSDGYLEIDSSRITHNERVFGSTYRCPPVLRGSYVAHNDLVLLAERSPMQASILVDNEFRDNGVVVDALGLVEVSGNTFVRNDVAVRALPIDDEEAPDPSPEYGQVELTNNLFLRNGDAIYVLGPGTLTNNRVERSSGWGIYAPNVTDGGGNAARGNAQEPQCTGVVCS